MHEEWTDLLSAYLDDELDAVTRRRVDAHLAECRDCANVLEDLRRIVAAAPTYQGQAPKEDLWAPIVAKIDEGRTVAFPVRRGPGGTRLRDLIAAGLVMAAVGAGATWFYFERHPVGPKTIVVAEPPSMGAAMPVSLSSAGYDQAIAQLEQTLAANRGRLDTATVRILQQSLQAIDQAIAEARSAIQRDSSNQYLNGQIAANMRKKLNVLKLATRAIASET